MTHFEDQSDEFAQPIYAGALQRRLHRQAAGYPRNQIPAASIAVFARRPGEVAARSHARRLVRSSGPIGDPHLHAERPRACANIPTTRRTTHRPGYVPEPLAPEVVATGQVLPGVTSPALDPDALRRSRTLHQGKTFGVIGAWDGHRVGKGRVVVDATWHHFFDINISGDRYLENNSLGSQHEQKLHGFFVPDGSGGRIPNAHYRMIMWYFRNIIYWLIPADRYQSIWWWSLIEIVKRPQLSEELSGYRRSACIRNSAFGTLLVLRPVSRELFRPGARPLRHVRRSSLSL